MEQRNAGPDVADGHPEAPSETYWPYISDPPVLHPVIWEGREIVVTVNDTPHLDQLAIQEFLIAQNFCCFAYDKRIHLCFAKEILL